MKLFVSTPCFGGQMETKCVGSIMSALSRAMSDGVIKDYALQLEGDSLIHRVRNKHAMQALDMGFDRILTIDSDIEFSYDDFLRVVKTDLDIVGGSYPLKTFPIVVNFNPLVDRGTELLKTNRGYDFEAFEEFKKKYADPATGLAEVRHLPTGFLSVSMRVFSKLSESVEVFGVFQPENGLRKGYYDFYPSRIVNQSLESEDWGFCRLASEAGFKIWFDTRVIVGHVGAHTYRYGQVFGELVR